ncbi:MAG: hypothetical protein ACRDUV_24370, partial [Pseudonocardiaceae bacterium]
MQPVSAGRDRCADDSSARPGRFATKRRAAGNSRAWNPHEPAAALVADGKRRYTVAEIAETFHVSRKTIYR